MEGTFAMEIGQRAEGGRERVCKKWIAYFISRPERGE